jgi:hypothetical protein
MALPLAVIAVLVAAMALRWRLLAILDLRDLPGAAGGQAITDAAAGAFHQDWGVWLIGLLLPLTDGDIIAAAHLVALLSGGAMLLGVTLGGAALAGWRGALAGAVVGATWSQALLVGLLVGPDPPAVGAAWLGVGLCWWAARRRGPGALLAGPGAALVVGAVAIKELALPAVPLLVLTPLIGRGWGRLVGSVAALAGGWWALDRLSPDAMSGELQHNATLPAPDLASIVDGLRAIWGMARGWPDGLLEQLLLAALLGGILPGPRWGARATTALVSVAVLGLTATALGGRLCPRLLLAASFGVVAMLAALAARLPGRTPWGILLIGAGLSLDSLAWLGAWSAERTAYVAAAPADLPAAPRLWAMRYESASYAANNGRLRDIATTDGVILARHAAAGIGLPPLRDRRDEVALALATLGEAPSALLHPRLCCQEDHPACARRLVRQLDDAGMTLIIPSLDLQDPADPMVDRFFEQWCDQLAGAAATLGGLTMEGRWLVRLPTGSGGAPPCPEATARSSGGRGAEDWPPPTPR